VNAWGQAQTEHWGWEAGGEHQLHWWCIAGIHSPPEQRSTDFYFSFYFSDFYFFYFLLLIILNFSWIFNLPGYIVFLHHDYILFPHTIISYILIPCTSPSYIFLFPLCSPYHSHFHYSLNPITLIFFNLLMYPIRTLDPFIHNLMGSVGEVSNYSLLHLNIWFSFELVLLLLSYTPRPVVGNCTSTLPLLSPARTLRILQLKDYRWIKAPTNYFDLSCTNPNAKT
jgi:hypothetical protein